MCNNLLFDGVVRQKCSGLKHTTDDADARSDASVVGEHFQCAEASAARRGGALGRENVGMSNPIFGEKPDLQKSKVSAAMAINCGLGGPKAMAKAAADGQTVNIPSPPFLSMEGRSAVCRAS